MTIAKRLQQSFSDLKDRCLRCWAQEFSNYFPRRFHTKIASEELKKYGNPDCLCMGKARLIFLKERERG